MSLLDGYTHTWNESEIFKIFDFLHTLLLHFLLAGFLGVALGGLLIGGGGGGGMVSSLVGYCPVLVGHFCSLSTGLLGLRISAPPGRLRCGGG